MTKLIGICGGSGSGKTTLALQLKEIFSDSCSILRMDDYYLPLEIQAIDGNGITNFDLPSALNIEKYSKDLHKLKEGQTIEVKEYSFNKIGAKQNVRTVEPNDWIISEGIFIMSSVELRNLFDVLIFIKADTEVMFKRRMKRDSGLRGIEDKMIQYQWVNHFLPAYNEFVLPFSSKAHYFLDGNQPINIEIVKNWI